MRAVFVAALLIATLLPMPGAAAKAFSEDGAGDAQLTILGQPTGPAPANLGESIDLLSLDVAEDAEDMTFTLAITNLKQTVNFAEYDVHFTWDKTEWTVVVQRQVVQGAIEDSHNAYLVSNSDRGFDIFANLDSEIDVDAGTIVVHMPKAYILAENGKYPLLGDALDAFWVESMSHFTFFGFSGDAYDRMPDDGDSKYEFLFGDIAGGHLRLDADERVRVSNGGSTTFVYQVVIGNKADSDDDVDLEISELPEGWNATYQSPLRVPGGSERKVAVLVSVPFAHVHGGFSSFNVTVRSQEDDASFASIRMGVLHTPIPQPAGHHSEIFLHSHSFSGGIFGTLLPFSDASMNTESAHDGDAAEASSFNNGDGSQWWIPLSPGLRMGMDFDITRAGEIAGAIIGHGPSTTGSIRAELLLVSPDGEETTLLGDTDSADLALDMSTPQPFKLVFTPTEDADYIPYLRGQNLALALYLSSDNPTLPGFFISGMGSPALQTADFKMTLPLNEYHDKLTGASDIGDLLEIKAEGPVEKAGLPGATLTYAFTLTNHGKDSETIDLDLAGTDAALGTLVPAGSVTLDGKESRKITMAVTIPTGRNEGEELEVLIFAHAQEDPSKSAIARTKTVIAKAGSADVAQDETGVLLAAQQAESNDTPAAGVFVALVGVGVAAFMLRRRSG